ncbi:MAG: cupin domain-containing protein [Candidatus Bathyarchaeota archaeon]|nr:cupin domain-containing protein [Candidatus Bathyarchaeota archaeon]MDH5686942.1 cupin domain-containing protein [Candidatus Bathyarchaeota archaeon]
MSEVPLITLVPGARSRLVTGERAMASFIEMDPDMEFPIHKHESEQVMIFLQGSMKQRVADEEFTLCKGDVLVMESNEVHGGKASEEGCNAIDIFVPPRKDYQDLVKTSA